MLFVNGESHTRKVVHENIAKINRMDLIHIDTTKQKWRR